MENYGCSAILKVCNAIKKGGEGEKIQRTKNNGNITGQINWNCNGKWLRKIGNEREKMFISIANEHELSQWLANNFELVCHQYHHPNNTYHCKRQCKKKKKKMSACSKSRD